MDKLTILHTEASTGWGGQEIRILRESLGMRQRGHRVLIAAPEGSGIYKNAKEAGLEVHHISYRWAALHEHARLARLMSREKVDVLNTHSSRDSWIASAAAHMLGPQRPLVIRTRHLYTPISYTWTSRLVYMILADYVMTTGEAIKKRMVEVNRFDPDRILSVPTGTDMRAFDPDAVSPTLPRTGFMVGMVSVLRSWKGHEHFLQAVPAILREVPEARFYIAGDGPLRHWLDNMIKEAGLEHKVTLLGHRTDVDGVMQSLDVLVHPSYGHEGVPQSILQALALKKPVVASDVGAIGEVVLDNRTGLLIPPRTPEAIAEAVVRLYRDPALGLRLAEEGRRLVAANYTIEVMLDKTEALYARLIDGRKV